MIICRYIAAPYICAFLLTDLVARSRACCMHLVVLLDVEESRRLDSRFLHLLLSVVLHWPTIGCARGGNFFGFVDGSDAQRSLPCWWEQWNFVLGNS
jgi:hypothetical protein